MQSRFFNATISIILPMVSAVILAYNRCSEVLITIQKLKQYSPLPFPLEIVVVDNASADNTSAEVRRLHPDVVLVTKKKNNAIAGWNDGFAVAKYKYFLVLDDDSHIESGLAEAINFLEENPKAGILALNVTTGPFISSLRWKPGQDTYGFYGCGAIIRKEVYEKIGGFSEWIQVYAHEWDYGLRCLDAGYRIIYFANSNVIHRTESKPRSAKRFWSYVTRNEMSIVYKYFGKKDRWKYIWRIFGNNFKRLKAGEFKQVYYCTVGAIMFLKLRKNLAHAPVAREVSLFFANTHRNTHYPVFGFINNRIKRLFGLS